MRGIVSSSLVALLLFVGVAGAVQNDPLKSIRPLVKSRQYDKALPRLESFLKEHPENAEARFLQGLALAESGRADEAQEIFLALTGDYPELPEPYNNLAVLYAAKGEYNKARDALIVAITNHPNYATAHENLGDIYARMAGIAYGKALEIDDENQTARVKLAMVRELFSERGPAGGKSD